MLARRSFWVPDAGISITAVIVAVVAFAAVSGAPATRRADKIERVPKSASEALGYVAFLPPSYSTDGDKPTIIYLHGLGELGNGSASDLNILLTAGLPRLAATNTLPDDASQLLILAPQTEDEYFDPDKLDSWLAHVLQSYRMDRTRLYLTGISMGGQGVFDYLAKYGAEQEFAAAVPISGNYLPLPPEVPPRVACPERRCGLLWESAMT
jgi:poly(3-hydroxybutyrate) depolymerase